MPPIFPQPSPAEPLGPPIPAIEPTAAGSFAPRHPHLTEAAVATAARLLPLVRLLESIQAQLANDSIFHLKRLRIQEEMTRAYGELLAEKPRHKALLHAFKALTELVREEAHDLSKDELKQAAREVALATLKNAPKLISAAHQARLLS